MEFIDLFKNKNVNSIQDNLDRVIILLIVITFSCLGINRVEKTEYNLKSDKVNHGKYSCFQTYLI